MDAAARHAADPARVAALRSLELLDTPPEPAFDHITEVVRDTYDVPIALVSLVDADRQWFKSCIGLAERETDLERSFCARAILSPEPLVVGDAACDERFATNPAVVGEPFVRFYAGVPLTTRGGHRIGTLCIIDREPREVDDADLKSLRHLAAVASDLVEIRAQALRAVAEADEARRLGAVVATSDDAIITYTLDGTITGWNDGAVWVYGYRPDEVIGKNISLLVPEGMGNDVPTILAKVAAGERVRHYETKRRSKKGVILDISLSVSPLPDESGKIVGAAVIARDITEAKRAAATAEEQAELLELADDAIWARDLADVITYWNKAASERYGWSRREAMGRITHDLLQTVFPEPQEEIERTLLREGRWEGDLVHTARDGRRLVVASRWSLRRDHDGRPLHILEVNNDITAQRKAEQALVAARDEALRANSSKTEFLSRMSHELRTPLNAILGFAQLLSLEELSEGQRESTEQIMSGGRRLLGLINEVLDIARIEGGQLPVSIEPVPVVSTVMSSIELIAPLANQRAIRIASDIGIGEGSHVLADRQRLDQVLLNLLSNAVKYNVEGGTIRVEVARGSDQTIRVTVQDSGPGIEPDDIPRLFVPFDRLGAEQTAVEGTGLGLPLAKSLVESMGGTLSVQSAAGKGTAFHVELRTTGSPRATERRPRDLVRASSRPSDHTLLYIEDNVTNRELLERLLESQRPGTTVIASMTGHLGIDLAREHHPDLILLDLHLPDLEGDEILARLRKDPRTADIPVVILSADAMPGRIKRLLEAGARDYVSKPIDLPVLLDVLDRVLTGPVP